MDEQKRPRAWVYARIPGDYDGTMDAPLLERPTADYIKMSRQIAALGNNLNQLAHIANASGKVSNTDLLTAKQIMEQIWRYIKGGGVQ